MIKKSLKKAVLYSVSAFMFSLMVAGTCEATSQACEIENIKENVMEKDNVTRSPIIEYRYKIIDGKLYRRLYNYSDEYWIGEWELVPLE